MRGDVAAAASRMKVVFGTRSAMKHLVHSLEAGENVREMVACLFAGADGLLVLTDRRVLALRDDYSRYSIKAAALPEITLIDYGPTVHDGFAVFTDSGRVAVRKMHREDSDRLVEVLTQTLPGIPVVTSQPRGKAGTNARRATPPRKTAAVPEHAVRADVGAGAGAADQAGLRTTVTVAGPDGSSTQFIADHGGSEGSQGTAAGSGTSPSPVVPAPVVDPIPAPVIPPPAATAAAPSSADGEAVPTDKEVLYGVLADLHARGLLTAEELAVKVAAVAASP